MPATARPNAVRRAEAQPVEERDRPGAHRDDVAEDPADPGRGTLERLDRRRVVVALDLERDRLAAADVDHARVLARALEDGLALGREAAQEQRRVLVASAPTRGENTASSKSFGSRSIRAQMRSNSPSVRPSARWSGVSATGLKSSPLASVDSRNTHSRGERGVARGRVVSVGRRARLRPSPAPRRRDLGCVVHVHRDRGGRDRAGADDGAPAPARRLVLVPFLMLRRGVGPAIDDLRTAGGPGAARRDQQRRAVHADHLG